MKKGPGLLDTGPLVSFLASGLRHHSWTCEQWKCFRPPLPTCEPVLMVPYPPEVIAEIDKIVSQGDRTAFLVDLAKREIKLNRQRNALRAAKGAWTQEDHPELAQGAAQWVRDIRQESVKRFEKIEHHREA